MAQEKIEIKFIATGNVPLVKAIRELQKQTQKLNTQLSKLNKVNVKVAQTQHLVTQRVSANSAAVVRNSTILTKAKSVIALYRNTILLAAFAASLLTKALINQVRAYGKQEASVRRLGEVFGGDAVDSLSKFSSELQKNSNFGDEVINVTMAQIGAFGASIEQTKRLTVATADLAEFLGQDLSAAGLLVAKTIGSTTDALGRYGVGVGDAVEQSERIENVISSITKLTGGLAEELSKTTSGQLNQASMAFGDLSERLGQVFAPTILAAARAMRTLAEALPLNALRALVVMAGELAVVMLVVRTRILTTTAALIANTWGTIGLAIATGGLSGALIQAAVATKALAVALVTTGVGALIVGLGILASGLYVYFSATEESIQETDRFGRAIKTLDEKKRELLKSQGDNIDALQQELDLLNAANDMQRMAIKLGREHTEVNYGLTDSERDLFNQIEAKKEQLKAIEKQEKLDIKRQEDIAKIIADVATMHEDAALTKMKANLALIQTEMQYAQAIVITNMLLGESSNATLEAEDRLTDLEDTFATLNKAIEDYGIKAEKNVTVEDKLLKAYDGTIGARIKAIEATIAQAQATALSVGLSGEELAGLIALVAQLNKLKAARDGVDEGQIIFLENTEKVLGGLGDISSAMGEMANIAASEAQAHIDVINELADAEIDIITNAAKTTIAEEKKTRKWQKMSAKQQADYEKKILDGVAKSEAVINERRQKEKDDAAKKANKLLLQQFKLEQALSLSQAFINTYTGVTAALKLTPPMSFIMAGITLASGLANVALISKQKPPKMEAGGLIGGSRHSQGGTTINAEQGEFIMNRNAVQSVGLETMNRINQGGGGGSINISFAGNVLSKDFIEDEAIPQIKEALRRGGDIGIG